MNESSPEPLSAIHTPLGKTAVVLCSGLAINWLADLLSPSTGVIVAVVVFAVGLLVLSERRGQDRAAISPTTTAAAGDLVKLMALGAVVGSVLIAIAMMPVFETVSYRLGERYSTHNYEIVPALLLTLVACVSAVRRSSLARWWSFLVGGFTGMAATMTALDSENDALPSFVGWLIPATLVAGLIHYRSELRRVAVELVGSSRTAPAEASETERAVDEASSDRDRERSNEP